MFSGGGDSASENTEVASVTKMDSNPTEDLEEAITKNTTESNEAKKQVATNLEEAGANAINIQLAELIEVTKKSNKLISALNGNVMAG